jgi:hypothetical protein
MKNMAKAHWRMSELKYGAGDMDLSSSASLARYHAFQSLEHTRQAVKRGLGLKPVEWIREMEEFGANVVTMQLISWLRQLPDRPQRITQLTQAARLMLPAAQAEALLEAATCQFFLAITVTDHTARAMSALNYAEQLVGEAESARINATEGAAAIGEDLIERTGSMRDSIVHHQTIHQSALWREQGDVLLEKALADLDGGMVELVWDAIDMFKQSIIMARERDLESEAISSSRIGELYDKCLKARANARVYYKHAVQVALSLSPRDFSSADWFVNAQAALLRYQREVLQEEESERKAEQRKYDTELKPVFDQIRAADQSAEQLVRFVYQRHPPKNAEHRLDEAQLATQAQLKKVLQRAMTHYHPDKQPVGQDREARIWFFTAEEISKRLTAHYNAIKGF